jgi:hypothetical protein
MWMKRCGHLGRLALMALQILTVSPGVGEERKSTPNKTMSDMEMP